MIMEPMDIVKQTGKTIIFEEFNKEKFDLVSLLTKDAEEISLEKFKDELMGKQDDGSNAELIVESFEEFVEKFSPTVYETVVRTGENSSKFVYELERPNKEGFTEIRLKDHAFYKMIMALIDRKATTDKGNMEFPYESLKKALTPEAEMEECKRIRKNLEFNTQKYMELVAKNEPSPEKDRYANNVYECREKIVSKYQNKSPLALLPLLIADKQKQIDAIDSITEENDSEEQHLVIPCDYSLDDRGNIILIEQSVSDDKEESIDNEENSIQLVEALKDDFRDYAPESIRENGYISNLIVDVFVPNGRTQLAVQDKNELEQQKKQYQDVYKDSLESFAKAVAKVVEKFAGVKTFFDHATYDGKLARNVSVIIANCKINAILNDNVAKERFKKYFKSLASEKDINKIWFGIIPAIEYENQSSSISYKKKNANPFGKLEINKNVSNKVKIDSIDLEATKEMLRLLDEAKIMTFINYKASGKTGFIELTEKQVEVYKKNMESIDSEYTVFAYPNFTILPEEKNATIIGKEYEETVYVQVPGIYLEASYVAAGIMVGIQNYKLLKGKGYKVNPKYPCVRFDIEDGDNAKRITTKLNRETTTEMEKNTKDIIMEDRFGFVFGDNRIIYDGKTINNSYVLNARTLKKDRNGKYKSIYKILVRNLVDQILRTSSDYVTDKSVKNFISEYADEWKRDNKDEDRKYANRILKEEESIELDSEKHKLVVKFNKEEEVWDEIIINDEEGEI
ncbi:MAG: hypothetical protein ACLVEI_04180 [Anaerobutyricum soehngenii]